MQKKKKKKGFKFFFFFFGRSREGKRSIRTLDSMNTILEDSGVESSSIRRHSLHLYFDSRWNLVSAVFPLPCYSSSLLVLIPELLPIPSRLLHIFREFHFLLLFLLPLPITLIKLKLKLKKKKSQNENKLTNWAFSKALKKIKNPHTGRQARAGGFFGWVSGIVILGDNRLLPGESKEQNRA